MARLNLKSAREKANMTQNQVAQHLQISVRMYKFIESGDRIGSIELWDKLEDIFNIHQRILRENTALKDNQ